jgi:hypothetical protein
LGGVFEGIRGTQGFAFQARLAPIELPLRTAKLLLRVTFCHFGRYIACKLSVPSLQAADFVCKPPL